MLIQKNSYKPQATRIAPKTTLAEKPFKGPESASDGFYSGASITAGLMMGATTTLSTISLVGLAAYTMGAGASGGITAGALVGTPVGLGLSYLANKGLNKVGAAIDKDAPKRAAAIAKTVVASAGTAFMGGNVADVATNVGIIAAGGAAGAAWGYFANN